MQIKEAKDELIKLSADAEQRRLYSIRAKMLKDEASALNKAKREGIEQGREEGIFNERINTAKRMKEAGMTVEMIMSITQLEKQDIEQL